MLAKLLHPPFKNLPSRHTKKGQGGRDRGYLGNQPHGFFLAISVSKCPRVQKNINTGPIIRQYSTRE